MLRANVYCQVVKWNSLPPAFRLGLKEGVERPSRVAAWFLTKVRGLRAPPRRLRNVGIHSARSGLSGSRLGIAARPLYAACRRNTAAGSIPHSRRQPVERLLRWDGVIDLLPSNRNFVKWKVSREGLGRGTPH